MKKDFTSMYCFVDDFMKDLYCKLPAINSCKSKPGMKNYLSSSEVLTILIGYYESCCDCFKHYYETIIMQDHDFKLVSYVHFTKLIGRNFQYLVMLLILSFNTVSKSCEFCIKIGTNIMVRPSLTLISLAALLLSSTAFAAKNEYQDFYLRIESGFSVPSSLKKSDQLLPAKAR